WLLLTLLAIPTPAPAVGDASLVEIPMAMLIGIAVVEVVAPAVMSTTPSVDRTRVLIVGLLGAGLLAAVGFPMATQTGLYALTVEQRAAMRWVAESLPVNARFAVVTGRVWPQDAVSEWFPALSGRVSLGTPQGFEWTTAWQSRVNAAVRLQSCATQAQSC